MTKIACTLIVDCKAPDDLFVEDYPTGVSKETQRIVEKNRGIPCEGTRSISESCWGCPWFGSLDWENYEELEA